MKTLLNNRRVVICLGPGGVGKTTLSAALAVHAAASGRSVDVMTVDPAPRLLDALGLNPASSEPQEVALDGVAVSPHRASRLRALRLDPKHTFDALVARYAPSEFARDAILRNRIYHNLSDALCGVADYMAMEKLLELRSHPGADLLVLDTPPASEALDFLDAPRRLLDLLNSRAVSLLGASKSLFHGGLVDFAARGVLAAFDRVTGLHLLRDVQAFVDSFEGMYTGFAERAQSVNELLRSAETALLVITTAGADTVFQAKQFVEAMHAAGLRVDAVVVNRLMPALPQVSELKRAGIPAALARKLARNVRDFAALKQREQRALKQLYQALSTKVPMIAAPDLGEEPRSLTSLAEIASRLGPIH